MSPEDERNRPAAGGRQPAEPPSGERGVRRYRAAELIGDAPWMVIEHGEAEYRLRITRLGKLILTK